MDSSQIRSTFFKFFEEKKHKIVDSAPMVLKNDPSLMFTNAGMNQFKSHFLDCSELVDKRVANTQKCLRVSGKHNDLEEVGIDTYHHTMFEMLGNWSFGEYFKKEAIEWAWELLTEVYKIEKKDLYVTVFEGSVKDGTMIDSEANDIWKGIIDEDRIVLGNKNDNFWEMGDQGPCGPSSEIHIDIRPEKEKNKLPGIELVNKDHPEVIEIWNLVFIEFNRKKDGSLEKLPSKHIDTGMGLERLSMVIQGHKSNYDTDIFKPLINELEQICRVKYGEKEDTDTAIRVVVDHVRAIAFSIADGQLPSNNGAGYVIRRILRRGVRYGYTFLNQKNPFIYKLVKKLSFQFSSVFPEIKSQIELIENVIKDEENAFFRTLENGIIKLNQIIKNISEDKISGDDAFLLYDTYGFPIDLTSLILKEKGLDYDHKKFEKLLEKQKIRSKSDQTKSVDDWIIINNSSNTTFIGYDHFNSKSKILKYRLVEYKNGKILYQIVFDKTPFYAEGGGQIGDSGFFKLDSSKSEKFSILNTFKENETIIHISDKIPKNKHQEFLLNIDHKKRSSISRHHTATHLLHQALRNILGDHVQQKGSLVSENYLRFDFSHFSKLTYDELKKVETFVNEKISEKIDLVEKRDSTLNECLELGAIALFGEKYGKYVRSIKFGDSFELCGGTHVKNTIELRTLIITSESAISTGVRRIEALCGDSALDFLKNRSKTIDQINKILSTSVDHVDSIKKLKENNSLTQKKLDKTNDQLINYYLKDIQQGLIVKNDINFCSIKINCEPHLLKNIAFKSSKLIENLVLIIGSIYQDKVYVVCQISKNLTEKKGMDAREINKKICDEIGGNGGGQSFFTTASSPNTQKLDGLLNSSEKIVFNS